MQKIENTTCFAEHEKRNLNCKKRSCKYWMKCPAQNNCVILAAKSRESRTLQEIGDMFGLTRMRICQIEKVAIAKIKSMVSYR